MSKDTKKATILLFLLLGQVWALPAFPGAEGFGANAVGARGGEVYHVSNLNDSGAGSLRDALSKSGRTIVFDVGGVIRIGERLIVPDHTTIAGQTAPGGGITIYGNGVAYNTNNVITRHIRVRMGKVGTSGKDAISIAKGHDMIWDHVSVSWGRDGTFDVNPDSDPITNITIQNSIIGQGLQTHSTGGLMIAQGASILRSLYIDNNSRNPKARQTTQFVNNVIYNWTVSGYILGDTEGRSDGYMVGNFFITGPNTSGGTLSSPTAAYHIYAVGNLYDNNKDGTLNGRLLGQGDFGTATWHTTPSVAFPTVTEWTAQDSYENAFANVGANRFRDAVDSVMLYQLKSLGKVGSQISDETSLGLTNTVGIIPGGAAPTDTDQDGMPDTWENAHGLNPNEAEDRNSTHLSPDGYTSLEMYLNELAGDPVVFAAANNAPNFTSNDTFEVAENSLPVGAITATDADGDQIRFGLSSSSDSALFQVDSMTGLLSFVSAPDFENPKDNGNNNIHHLMVTVSDGKASTTLKHIVIVKDVDETVGTKPKRDLSKLHPGAPETYNLLGQRIRY